MKKLYRSTRDKKLFGLCGGISEAMGVDATLLRILAIVLAVFTSGAFILIYILAALVVPKEPPYNGFGPNGFGGYGGYTGYNPPGAGGGYYNNNNGGGYANSNGGGYGGGWSNWQNGDGQRQEPQQAPPQNPGNLDAMMDDLEKKALRKEIDDLKAKLAKYEKGE